LSTAADVNESGIVVGQLGVTGGYRGFVYKIGTGQYTILNPLPGGVWAGASAINNAGVVCGWRSIGSKESQTLPQSAFIWTQQNGFTDLGTLIDSGSTAWSINSSGTVVGRAGNFVSSGERGFVHENGITNLLPFIPNGLSSGAKSINDYGVMVIDGLVQVTPQFVGQHYVVDRGLWTPLSPLPGDSIAGCRAIANDGTVVGISTPAGGSSRACIWRNGAPRRLVDLVSPPIGIGRALAISDTGQIATEGSPSSQGALVLTAITTIPGDVDCNSRVDVDDLVRVITRWGPCQGCDADMTGNGDVDIADLVQVIQNWSS
jgi:probable HAF family extracellular repeat protein